MRLRTRTPAKISLILVMLLTSLLWGTSAAANGQTKETVDGEWAYAKPIVVPGQLGYYELYLDPEVYGAASDDLRDLRIVDSAGKYVPYYRENGEESSEEYTTTYSSTLVHSAKKDGNTLFDYRITPLAENIDIQGNRLEFNLPDEDFLLHVQLLGSYDGVTWEPATKGILYAVGGRQQNVIELGSSYKYGYYRLVAEQNAANLQFPELTLLSSSRVTHAKLFSQQLDADYEITQTGRQTEILIHNPDRLKIAGLQLESSGSFARRFELYDGEGRLIPVTGSGELYRLDFKDTEIASTTIAPASAPTSSELKLTIYNEDDAPIPLTGLKLEYSLDRLVFNLDGALPYRLLYGNADAAAPQYDIVNFKNYISKEEIGLAQLGEAEPLQTAEAAPGQASWFQGRLGFNIVIIAISLLLILFLARKLGRK